MNLKNKKTVLSDDAALYSHREDVSEKEKWETMTFKERFRYFADYYLGKIVIIVIVAAVLISVGYTMLRPRPDTVLSVAVVEDYLNQPVYDDLKIRLEEHLELIPKEQETVFHMDFNFSNGDYQSWQTFSVYNMVGDLDVTLMPKSTFEEMEPENYFNAILPYLSEDLKSALEPYFLAIEVQNDDGAAEGTEVYAIDLSESWIYDNVQQEEPMVLVVNAAPENAENIEKFINFLFFPDDAK